MDDQLLYVTTEGDHLRTYLENVKAPFEDSMDSNVYTAFAHNIRLVDGVYLQKSISAYADVISALTEGGGIHTYTAVEGDTVQSVVYTTGVSFDSLAQMNPELLTLDQEIPEGTVLLTGASSAELIKVKVLESSMYNAREASVKLAEATGADCVQVIGSKFVLYLQKKKDSAYAALLK